MTAVPTDLAAVFERAPVLAQRVSTRVVARDTAKRILGIAREEIARMSEAERIAVLDAHPRIGATAASLSTLSRAEQGLSATEDTDKELAALNDAYERKFGFRFVVFVNGRTRSEIVPVLRERLGRSRDDELATGIREFLAITGDRLAKAGR